MRSLSAIVMLGGVVMTGCATTYKAGAPKGAVNVIAHRGASAYAPENTLAAFALAAEQGADWFELDCTLSKDGEVIVIHDDDVERTTGGTGKVADLTLAELKALDAGSWFDPKFAGEKLPTLGEALDLAKGRIGVYIEIKDSADDRRLSNEILKLAGRDRVHFTPGQRRRMMRLIEASGTRNLTLTEKVVELVRERGMERQVVIQSFSPIICAVALGKTSRVRVELLGGEDEDNPARWPTCMRWCYLLDVKGFNPDQESLTKERLDCFHRGGRSVAVWTVDAPEDMRRFAQWGVDGIITNKPDVCLSALREAGMR